MNVFMTFAFISFLFCFV